MNKHFLHSFNGNPKVKTFVNSIKNTKAIIIGTCLSFLFFTPAFAVKPNQALEKTQQQLTDVLKMPHRQADSARDQYRRPLETLMYFEVKPHHSIAEIWPGDGWYANILAPFLKMNGEYYAAHFNPKSEIEYFKDSRQKFDKKVVSQPLLFSETITTIFDPPELLALAPPNSLDRVLTFRNVHNWYMRGGGEKKLLSAFQAFHASLKPGGILGVVDHRLPEDRPLSDQEESGYMKQSYVIAIAEKAGFKFIEASELNANPADTANHPNGVWTLPPRLRVDENLQKKYSAIGESDRMTLKFRKPVQ